VHVVTEVVSVMSAYGNMREREIVGAAFISVIVFDSSKIFFTFECISWTIKR